MSSSGYCQGLQSCLEPARLVEVPRVLRLKLAPSKPNTSRSPTPEEPVVTNPDCDAESNENVVDMGGWSFIQCLDNANSTSKSPQETSGNWEVYVHPTVKRSSSALSGKSLEMCTESLGSETGSDGGDTSEEMALLSSENDNYEPRERASNLRETRRGVIKRSASFPPLLTSISGSTSVKMRSHREGGRLVLKAETIPSSRTAFQAERSNGRLRIHFLTDYSTDSENGDQQQEAEEEEAEEAINVKASSGDAEDNEDDDSDDDNDIDEKDNCELEGDSDIESEMGMGSLLARRWCKGDESENKDVLNWEPFWVAA